MEERKTGKSNRASKDSGGGDKAKRKINYAVEKRTRESNWKEVPSLPAKDPLPIAVFCGDIHLSHKPPLFRSIEKDWYETQKGYLQQLFNVAWSNQDRKGMLNSFRTDTTLPIICAGDVFDKWNSPPELINLALEYLPEMYAVPGQHDLPNHSYENIKKSAFWTLVEAGKIKLLEPGNPISIDGAFPTNLHGFPYGYEISPPKKDHLRFICREIAVIHSYIWTMNTGYPGAPVEKSLGVHRKSLEGYDVAVYADNHFPFENVVRGKCTVYNCILPECYAEAKEIKKASKAFYSGEAIEITCSSGNSIRLTANHPVLTPQGFVTANKIDKGHQLFCSKNSIDSVSMHHKQSGPSKIEDIFSSFKQIPTNVVLSRKPTSGEDLHGDSKFIEGDIDIVVPNRELPFYVESSDFEYINNFIFKWGGMSTSEISSTGSFYFNLVRIFSAFTRMFEQRSSSLLFLLREAVPLFSSIFCYPFPRLVSDFGVIHSHSCRRVSEFNSSRKDNSSKTERFSVGANSSNTQSIFLRKNVKTLSAYIPFDNLISIGKILCSISDTDSFSSEKFDNCGSGNPHILRDGFSALPREISLDDVIRIRKFNFTGHVYDLQTGDGLILSGIDSHEKGIYISNCGGFMRRKSDDTHHPSIGLFYPDGTIKRHYLDISQDNYLSGEEAKEISSGIGMQSFIEELTTLGDAALNFAESMNRLLERDKVPEEVKQLILNAMER